MNVTQFMQEGAVTALPGTPVKTIQKVMDEKGFGILLIAEAEGRLVGFVTRAAVKAANEDVAVERIAHAVKATVSSTDTLEKAALIMLEQRLVLLPVTEDGRLIGVITQSEILRGLAQGLGIGLEATRLSIQLRPESQDLYNVLEILRAHGAHVISIARGEPRGDRCEIVLRIQGVADRDQLREKLENCLRDA